MLTIIYREIGTINPYSNNPRHNDDAVEKVVDSINEFGFRNPIIIDANGTIIAGHTRYKAAIKLGFAEVPCITADDLTPEQVKAYRITDNKSAEYAQWDFEALAQELEELQATGFNLALTSFGQEELDDILNGLEDGAGVEDDDFDEVIDPTEDAFTKLGDIWVIGGHRVMCGDSTQVGEVARLMDGAKADLAVTDPPYNVQYEGKTADRLTIQNDNMENADFFEFLLSAHKNIYSNLKDGASIYVFHSDSEGHNFRRAFIEAGFKLAQCCIWVKNSMVMGRQDYQWQHEPVLYGWKPTAKHHWNADRCQTTLWNFDRPTRSLEHPTMKPIPLIAYPIQNSSRKRNLVLDLFGGSGTTLIACEKTGRTCYTMEIEPLYCDVIVRRFIKTTNNADIRLMRDGDVVAFNTISNQFRL